ncbi:BREX protein BrxB domain-containing protein [Agromyces sp. C10]|uniref:BREX protein BrxB domain-containing protein n=1 Tax=Agromyces sp. C10 TaxID=2935077 RepID=UPI00200A8391|nr:BREX protein BrxB domain-containing protein [Agromyces sp. C10]MCK8609315.1 DUF1788 domain-containing protein [Agromyces sp. C10]
MTDLENLVANYGRQSGTPWATNLAPAQRCWMIVYPPMDERRLRARMQAFQNATHDAGKSWQLIDITDEPGRWIGNHPFAKRYFAKPELLSPAALDEFRAQLVVRILDQATTASNPDAVVALLGVGSLFGFAETSWLLNELAPHIAGRLAVFFPGEYRNSNYRLLEAREGWNYLALPITTSEEHA